MVTLPLMLLNSTLGAFTWRISTSPLMVVASMGVSESVSRHLD